MSSTPSIETQATPQDLDTKADRVRVDCYDGKYTVVQSHNGGLRALRYGEEWRDCIGDGLILALAMDLDATRVLLAETVRERENYNGMHQAVVMDLDKANARIALLETDNAILLQQRSCAGWPSR